MGIAKSRVVPIMKKTSSGGARKPIGLSQISGGTAMRVLLILQCLALFARADVSKEELQKWVQGSTLIFTGKIVALGSNVDSIKPSDKPITVEVQRVESGNDEALRKFGSLIGKQVTVIVNPSFKAGPKLEPGVSAVFFVNPLLYEKNMAVRAEAVADTQTVKDLAKQLRALVEEIQKKPLNDALKIADKVVSGTVEEVRPLPDEKLAKLQSVENGRYLYSEHSPRWREAVIHVTSMLKGTSAEKTVIVIFPSTNDRMWAKAPKCTVGQSGTWLLHTRVQLAEDRAKILLTPEQFHGESITAYTSLRPQDFQPKDSAGNNEKLIREMLKKSSP
jgi:hypothetical protein